MKGKFKKVKIPNFRSLWRRGPSRELLPVNVPPTGRSTDSQSAPTTQSPKDSQSASTTEQPTDPQLAPPAEIPPDSHSKPPTEIRTNSQSKPPPELGSNDSGSGADIEEQAQNQPQKNVSIPWKAMRTALRALEKNSGGLPPLKAAVGLLVACLDLTIDVIHNREEYEKLARELEATANDLEPYAKQLMERGDGGSVARIIKSINEELTQIKDKLGRGKFKRAMDASEDKDDIVNRYRKIDSLFRRLLSDLSLRTHIEILKLREATDTILLNTLEPEHDARYNSNHSITAGRRACTETTREQILQDLRQWADGADGADSKVFWINGMAGTGKTTILYSFCQWLEGQKRLGASFFCNRTSAGCRDPDRIACSLAYQLAHYSPALRSRLWRILTEKQSPHKLDVRQQLELVLQQPLQESKTAIPDGVIIVIDALDECDKAEVTSVFLETLIKLCVDLPVKFLLSSRPEIVIQDKMQGPVLLPSIIRLHEIKSSFVEADIKKYLEEELGTLSPPPCTDDIDLLTMRSGTLFIYAATVVRYLKPGPRVKTNWRDRLHVITGITPSSSNLLYKDLDALYTTVLSTAFANDALEEKELEDGSLILSTVVSAMEPMTAKTLSAILGLQHENVTNALSRLQSVLHVQEGPTGLVSILHASFPDFMFDKSRSLRFHCDPGEFHGKLSCFCFGVMAKELHFNICGLETSFLFDSNVPDLQQKIERNISDALFYSCRHWGNHLVKGSFAENIHTKLIYFLETHVLFWMEVLNVTRHITTGPKLLLNALNWLKKNNLELKDRKKLYDAKEFVEAFSMNTCNKSTPHIYISALPFCYKSNFVYANYWTKTQGLIRVNGSSLNEKRSGPIATWYMDYDVISLASSHSGTSFATGSYDGVRIYDADSGEMIAGPFKASGRPSGYLVTFSPDNTKLAYVCGDTICIWDVQTGNLTPGPLLKHTTNFASFSFSSDSKKLVSVAYDGTSIVWDCLTGNILSGPFESTDFVKAVGFTPDGFKIVSVSGIRQICLWDAEKGAILSGPFEAISTEHENGSWYAVALSSDRSNVAMGFSSGTILIIDASTGAVVIGPFPCNESVHELAFSHDGRKLFSRHESGFRVWNAQTGTLETRLVAKSKPGHFAVVPTPDGNKIISAPENNFRNNSEIVIWNTTNDDAVVAGSPNLPANGSIKSSVSSLVYSPDGRTIAAAFEDGCIGLWDAQTGKEILPSFQPHPREGRISISFSPDGANLVTHSTPSITAVRLWDSRTGKMIGEMLAEPSEMLGPVEALTHSHDGSKIAWSVRQSIPTPVASPSLTPPSSSPFEEYEEMSNDDKSKEYEDLLYTNTIRIWDLRSGRIIEKQIEGLIGGNISHVAFSPDDIILVLGSEGGELIMLSVDACEVIWRTPCSVRLLESVTSMAFSQDGTRFACGLNRDQLSVWNTTAKEMIPFKLCRARSQNAIDFIAFLTDGKKILTVDTSWLGTDSICLWDVETGDILVNFDMPYYLGSAAVAAAPGCSQLATSTHEKGIRTWEIEDVLASLQEMVVERIRSEFDNEDSSDSAFYSPQSVKLAMSRIANYHGDGWVKVDDRNIFWTLPDFRETLCYAYNPLIIGPYGMTLMDYSNMDLCIGKKWVNCWLAQ
ncbi:hypothetical protein D9613_011790 [Agrocybe pediades]|uniref:Nephrocystin 3-like N-terminal domain-containing protein n=1 Tax=Agrocybe pediades TaxID=84607 RepID=A0A8H4QKJ3_9AGAR|nr:hypothetical protein D9613_011790 [Agrocybe pediades]